MSRNVPDGCQGSRIACSNDSDLESLCRLVAHVGCDYDRVEGAHFRLHALLVNLIDDLDGLLPPSQLAKHIHQSVVGNHVSCAALALDSQDHAEGDVKTKAPII